MLIFALLSLWIVKCDGIPINQIDFVDTRHYSSHGYNFTIYNTDPLFNAAIRQRIIDLYFRIYPRLVTRFNPNAPRCIHVYIDNRHDYSFWGTAVDSKMIINARRLNDSTLLSRYYDIFLHELAHLVQQYTTQNLADVQWLGEGLADYVRYTYGRENVAADWPLPDYSSEQSFNDSYKVTARFLIWLEYRYNSSVINQLDKGLRDVTYNERSTWQALTGKSIEQLWTDYEKSPHLLGKIPFVVTATTMNRTKFI